jgi:antirestriction protein
MTAVLHKWSGTLAGETSGRSGRAETTPRIFVASLADYVAGRHHGAWLPAVDVGEVRAGVSEMLKASRIPGASEAVIHDFEGFGSYRLSEYETDFELVCAVGAAIQEHGVLFAEYLGHVGQPKDLGDVADALEHFEESYQGDFDSLTDWAEQFLEDTGALTDVPESLRPYIDVEKWADDAAMNGDIFSVVLDGRTHAFWSV